MDTGGLDPVPNNICACCDNPFLPNGMRGVLPQCGHQFHYPCIMRWREQLEGDKCPSCNQRYEEIQIRYPPGVRLTGARRALERDIVLPDREDLCAICHTSLHEGRCGRLNCNHVFCLHCILQWSDHRPQHYSFCPFCRQPFTEITMRYPETRRRTRAMRREQNIPYVLISSDSEDEPENWVPDEMQFEEQYDNEGVRGVPWDPLGYVEWDPNVFDPYHAELPIHPELVGQHPECTVCGNEAYQGNPLIRCAICQQWWHGYICEEQGGPPIRGVDEVLRCYPCYSAGVAAHPN